MIEGIPPQIGSILAAGNQAPSGENCQPWKFLVRGTHIEIHAIPERDTSYYNWGQRATYLSIGAVVENMVIAATTVGYKCKVDLFPTGETGHVASLELESDPAVPHDPLAPLILIRATNRKRYLPVRLSDAERKALMDSVSSGGATLYLTEEKNEIQRLAEAGAANEEIMLSNEVLHSFFFGHLNWTKEEDDAKKVGFFVKTLELPGPALFSFLILRYWPIMQLLVSIGFQKIIGKQNAATYAKSGAIGAIAITGDEPADFVTAGRAIERMWLTATQLGMSIQPLTGVLFFKLKIDKGEQEVFSVEHQNRIHDEYEAIQKIFGIVGARTVFMFRMGSGAVPSARSSRFPLEQITSVQQ